MIPSFLPVIVFLFCFYFVAFVCFCILSIITKAVLCKKALTLTKDTKYRNTFNFKYTVASWLPDNCLVQTLVLLCRIFVISIFRFFDELEITRIDCIFYDFKPFFLEANVYKIIVDLFLAGGETTGTSLDWALLYMIKYPDVQDRCFREISKVF